MTAAHLDRSFVAVGGAADVLAAALGAGAPRDAARRLRDLAPTLDLAEARAASRRDGRGVVVATQGDAALAVRWFAPGVATAVHDHGSWGAAVVVDGRDRYERFTLVDGRAVLDTTFWLEPGDARVVARPTRRRPPPGGRRGRSHRAGARRGAPSTGRGVRRGRRAPPPGRGRCSPPTADGVSPRCGSTTPRTCSSTSTCRPGASRSPDAPRSRSCSTATSWVFPTSGCARSGPCRRSTGVVVEVEVRARRGAETVQWRDIHVLHVRDGKVAEHVTYCTGHWDAAAIAGQDAEAPMVRP